MLKLPKPKKGGNLKRIKRVLNLPDRSAFILVVAWLLGALNPDGPYPILFITGQHGTAKTTFERLLRSVLDPSKAMVRSFPRSERDLVISAENSLIMAFDNVSIMTGWQADAMCRLATGSGFSTRELYENDSEMIFSASRPIIFNGIEPIISGHDLIDRCIVIELMPIPDEERKRERDLKKRFKKFHPKLLGALCDAAVTALKNRKEVVINRLPRMADFATWVVAAEPALPWGKGRFLKEYRRNIHQAAQKSIGADPVALAVSELADDKPKWKGTPTELLKDLESYVMQRTLKSRMWPKSASQLTRRLKMAAPFLRDQGVKISFNRSSKKRMIKIRKKY